MPTYNKGFDGSTAQWTPAGGAAVPLTPLLGVNYDDSAPEVAVTGSADTEKQFVVGRMKETVTVDFCGAPPATIVCGGKGALAVAFKDQGTLGTFGNACITRMRCSGRKDEAIKSTITIRPSEADAT
jgi:hypothetical protein